VPGHVEEVRLKRKSFIDKAMAEVKRRLTQEITYWDHRATELKADERPGKRRRSSRSRWMRLRTR
jgi:hypothetical protein